MECSQVGKAAASEAAHRRFESYHSSHFVDEPRGALGSISSIDSIGWAHQMPIKCQSGALTVTSWHLLLGGQARHQEPIKSPSNANQMPKWRSLLGIYSSVDRRAIKSPSLASVFHFRLGSPVGQGIRLIPGRSPVRVWPELLFLVLSRVLHGWAHWLPVRAAGFDSQHPLHLWLRAGRLVSPCSGACPLRCGAELHLAPVARWPSIFPRSEEGPGRCRSGAPSCCVGPDGGARAWYARDGRFEFGTQLHWR